MLYGGIVITDYFRNYVPVAPDLEVEVVPADPFTIDLSDFVLQGAREQETSISPSPGVLDKVPVQRGWRLRAIIEEEPQHGTVYWDSNAGALIYTAYHGYEGPDCFTYTLTNGFQKSLMAQVVIEIKKSYTLTISDIYQRNDGQYYIKSELYLPPESPPLLFRNYFWQYIDRDYQVTDEFGVDRVYTKTQTILQTEYTMGSYPYRIEYNSVLPWRALATNEGINGLIRDTEVPYRPNSRPCDLRLVIRLYFHHNTVTTWTGKYVNGKRTYYQRNVSLNLNRYTTLSVTLNNSLFGPRWYESGNIQQLDQ